MKHGDKIAVRGIEMGELYGELITFKFMWQIIPWSTFILLYFNNVIYYMNRKD